MATEEIAHSVISEEGAIQIREYEPTVIAEVKVKAPRREATGRAFRVLFNYIQGDNAEEQKIPMTAPVSQEMPMSAPVPSDSGKESEWLIAFYMPNDMSFEATPEPSNSNVAIRQVPARKMAAIKFSGFANDENINEHEQQLRAYLKDNDIAYEDKPLYAFYDAPMKPWFLRRNEVLFPLIKE